MKLIIPLAILAVFLIGGCLGSDSSTDDITSSASTDPQERCVELCREQNLAGVDLNAGPCLSETPDSEWDISDWACDIAHEPRKTLDDLSKNQCQKFRKEQVSHFVEVTPNCEFIRKA